MRFIMMGSGGVGGYFGARLAAAGHEVGFVARGAHLAALRTEGLRVRSARGNLHLHDIVSNDDPARLWRDGRAPDVAFVAVKLPDTKAACQALLPAVGPGTAVISLQNGIEAEDMLARLFGPGRVAGGVAYIAAAVGEPGTIVHTGTNHRIELGRLPGGEEVPVAEIVAALVGAGVDAEVVDDIGAAIWRKFVFLVALSAVTTATGRAIGAIREDTEGRALFAAVMDEAAAVGRAKDIGLPHDFVADRLAFTDTLHPEMRASMAHDFAAGKPLELDWLSGAVVRLGESLRVPTPVNRALAVAIRLRAKAR